MLPAVLAAARAIGSGVVRASGAAALRGSSAVNKVKSPGKLSDIAARIKRDAPGEIWRRIGGDQIPLADKVFNRWNDRRIERIDRYREIRETRAARKNERLWSAQSQKNLDEIKFEREQQRIIQKEEAAIKALTHSSAHDRALQASQREESNSFLERISNDIAQLKDFIFKNGICGGSCSNGILGSLSSGTPFLSSGILSGLGGVSAIAGISGKVSNLIRAINGNTIHAARASAPGIGSLAESVGGVTKNLFNGLRAGAANAVARGSEILTSFGESTSGMFKGGGATGRIAGTVSRIAGPSAAIIGAGLTGWEIGKWLNEKMGGTDIGRAKDRIFESIFAGVDKLVGSIGNASSIIPTAAGMSAFSSEQKADKIRGKAELQKFQRIAQHRFDQTEKTTKALIGAVDANTKATSETIEPLKTISDPEWLQNISEMASVVASKVSGWVSQKASEASEVIRNSSVGKAAVKAYETAKNTEVGKAIARVGENIKQNYESARDWVLGMTSKKYESGRGGSGTISSGKGDLGGKSYGTYQMTGKALENFVAKGKYADQFKGLKIKSEAFDAKWKELAADPEFGNAQHEFIKQTHFDPQHARLLKSGIDLTSRGPAVQDAIWSTSVQFGANTDLIKNALRGKDVSKMSDAEIVSAIQDYKIENNDKLFRSSSANVRLGTLIRARNEKADLLAMADNSKLARAESSALNKFEQKRVSPSTSFAMIAQLVEGKGIEKLASVPQTSIGDIVGEQTIEVKKAEQKAVQPIVIASASPQPVQSAPQVSGTTSVGSAPMVTRNQDSSIRRVTDGMMSYGIS